MIEKIQVLISQIENDLKAIATLFSRISPYEKKQPQMLEELIAVGYYLHNLYCAFENIFKNIAQTFENQLEFFQFLSVSYDGTFLFKRKVWIVDTTQWHAQLLKLMILEIRGIRPNIISQESYNCLDEFRRFRHLFRAAYDIELDWERMALVVKKALQLKQIYRKEISLFLQFLNDMQEVAE